MNSNQEKSIETHDHSRSRSWRKINNRRIEESLNTVSDLSRIWFNVTVLWFDETNSLIIFRLFHISKNLFEIVTMDLIFPILKYGKRLFFNLWYRFLTYFEIFNSFQKYRRASENLTYTSKYDFSDQKHIQEIDFSKVIKSYSI